jgi:hypothetical protein
MHQIQIQTRTSQLLTTHINYGTTHLVSKSPLDEYIDNSKCTKFEVWIQDHMKHN